MKRFKHLLRDTWWLWLIFAAIAFVMIMYVNLVFLIMIPILVCVFVYFALVRYNDDGDFLGS
jgi:hypothetical protein